MKKAHQQWRERGQAIERPPDDSGMTRNKPMPEWSEVERPFQRTAAPMNPLWLAIAETADTGKAVRVELKGRSPAGFKAALSYALRRRGFKPRCQFQTDGTVVVWAMRLMPTPPSDQNGRPATP